MASMLENAAVFSDQIDPKKIPFIYLAKKPALMSELKQLIRSELNSGFFVRSNHYEIRFMNKNREYNCKREWTEKLNKCLEKFQNKYVLKQKIDLKNSLTQSEFKMLEQEIETHFSIRKDLSFSVCNDCLHFEGLADLVGQEAPIIERLVNAFYEKLAASELRIAKDNVLIELLTLECFADEAVSKFPSLTLRFDRNSIHLSGNRFEIDQAQSLIENRCAALNKAIIDVEANLLEYFAENFAQLNEKLHKNNFKCRLRIIDSENLIEIHSLRSNNVVLDCARYLKQNYSSFELFLDDSSIKLIKNKKLNNFVQNLNSKIASLTNYNMSSRNENEKTFKVSLNTNKVCVSGEKLFAKSVYEEIKTFFQANTVYTKLLTDFEADDLEYLKLFAYDCLRKLDQEYSASILESKNKNFPSTSLHENEEKSSEQAVFIDLNRNLIRLKANETYLVKFEQIISEFIGRKCEECLSIENVHFDLIDRQKFQQELTNFKHRQEKKCLIKQEEKRPAYNVQASSKDANQQSTCFLNQIKLTNIYQEDFFSQEPDETIDLIVIYLLNETVDDFSALIRSISGQHVNLPPNQFDSSACFTSSGLLEKYFRQILHLPYSTRMEENRSHFYNSLVECEKRNYTKIAFTFLDEAYEQVFLLAEVLHDYFSFGESKSLIKEIYFFLSKSLIDLDIENLIKSQIKSVYDLQFDSIPCSSSLASPQSSRVRSEVAQNCITLDYMNTNLKIYVGDIVKSSTDCVVNPTNSELDLNGGVSKALISKDKSLVDAVKNIQWKHKLDGIAVTKSNNTNYDFVCHLDVKTSPLYRTMFDALNYLNASYRAKKITSITFPFIGTGAKFLTPDESARQMLEALRDYLNQFEHENKIENHLKILNVCVFKDQKDDFECFLKAIELFENRILDIGEPNDESRTESTSVKFKLISDDESNLSEAKTFIQNYIENEISEKTLENEYLSELSKEHKVEIERLCRDKSVKIKWHDLKKMVLLVGNHAKISSCVEHIFKIITGHAKKKEKHISAQLNAHNVEWQYKNSSNEWTCFNMFLNSEIEALYANKQSTNHQINLIDEQNERFVVDTGGKFMYYVKNVADRIDVRRVEKSKSKVGVPLKWDSQNDTLLLVKLAPATSEFEQVHKVFRDAGLPNKTIVSIERIQNMTLFLQYTILREEFTKRYTGREKEIEKTLFHGTYGPSVQSIYTTGFNRSYAGRHATAYGKGVYFATLSSYSHGYAGPDQNQKVFQMFVAKVLVGTFALGNTLMNVPPANFDTTVDKVENPSMYVIYKDAQAYPEYLITYK